MFDARANWIPAYYRDENLSGLMRTTSRSESENHFFCQVANSKLTLVEFFTHYDTAVDAQRFKHRKNDHDSRYTFPDLWTDIMFEAHAATIFTRAIFNDIQEEIYSTLDGIISLNTRKHGEFIKITISDFNAYGKGFLEVHFLLHFIFFVKKTYSV